MRLTPANIALLACATVFGSAVARAQTLVHSYEFNGNGDDSTGSVNLANPFGGSFATPGLFTFNPGEGLRFVGEPSIPSSYTIALRFTFTNTVSYGRIISFKDLTEDTGLYVAYNHSLFYDNGSGVGDTIAPDTFVDVVLTRSGGGLTNVYVNGVLDLSFDDTNGDGVGYNESSYVNNSVFWFFRDDNGENASGSVDRILIFDGPLSAGAVVGVLSPVPEPSSTALLTSAAVLGLAIFRRRRRGSS